MAKSSYNPDDQYSKIHQALIKQFEQAQESILEDYERGLDEAVAEGTKTRQQAEADYAKFSHQKRREWAKNSADDELKIRKQANDILNQYEAKLLAKSNIETRASIYDAKNLRLKAFKAEFEERAKNEQLFALQQSAIQDELNETLKQLDADKNNTQLQETKSRLEKQLQLAKDAHDKELSWIKENEDQANRATGSIIENLFAKSAEIKGGGDSKASKDMAEELREMAKQLVAGTDEAKALEKEAYKQEIEGRKKAQKEESDNRKKELKYRLTTLQGITETLNNAVNKAFDAIEKPISQFYEYQAKYEARLQGSENDYNKMMTQISRQIGLSPFVSQRKMVDNLQKLIDSGTNYNVELRAYIATVSENIASTFDAFDSNLLRLIRIQQNDSTAARLGMEAALTKVLNDRFSDTSYLGNGGQGLSDTVSGYLLDASAQLTHQAAAEFEFVTQKWLGALYSLGVGDQTITNIAQGLGYLGSGNTEALFGNDQLMTLLAMSAARGGTSISDFLTGNLSAENTNSLLRGMIELLADIANNTESNKVTKSAFANVFGISNTDLRSISNLTSQDIRELAVTNLTYAGALAESSNQLQQIYKRMHISEMVNTLIENTTDSMALTIGGNPATYALYKATSLVSSLVGDRGIEIPGITALGTGTTSGISVIPIMKAGIVGMGLLGSIVGAIENLGSGGLPALDRWAGYEQALSRGNGLTLGQTQSGFSQSSVFTAVGSQSSGDMTKSAMQTAKSSATENQSEEDKKTQEKAEKYQSLVSDAMEKLITCIKNEAVEISISKNNGPIPVYFSNAAEDTNTSAMSVNLKSVDGTLQSEIQKAIQESLMGMLRSALTNLDVNVTNTFFDDYYQKAAMNGGIN